MLNILVLMKLVPDVIEELEIAPDGCALDPASVRLILSERDDHALEQALLLKERLGGTVTVVAFDAPEIDDVLFTALARGANRAVKISGVAGAVSTRAAAPILARVLTSAAGLLPADLILTGVQAIDDLDGHIGPLLAQQLAYPYVGITCQVAVDPQARIAEVTREYAGGVTGTFAVPLPAVLGVQSAEKPPRYVPVAKVRAAMKSQRLESVPAGDAPAVARVKILQYTKPKAAGHAVMWTGAPEGVAAQLCDLLRERGLL